MVLIVRSCVCLAFTLVLGGPAASACRLAKVTAMPLIDIGTHVGVAVTVNDAARTIVVDTGAASTELKLSAATDLKLPQDLDLSHATSSVGVGQTQAHVQLSVIPSTLAFGELTYHDRSTAVVQMDDGVKKDDPSIGLLGDDILSQFDVEFDFPGKMLTFYRAAGCYDTFIPWTGTYTTLPFKHDNQKIVFDIFLNGERTPVIVDTGADGTIVSRRTPALWDASSNALVKTGIEGRSPLNGGTTQAVSAFVFGSYKIGDDVFAMKPTAIVDADLVYGSALIGLDYWRSHKVWISYFNNVMFVAKPGATSLAYPVSQPVGRKDKPDRSAPTLAALPDRPDGQGPRPASRQADAAADAEAR